MLAKSVNKLLLAESASKVHLIVVTWYFMFTFGLIYVGSSALEWTGMGHYTSQTRINAGEGDKMGPLFESLPRPLLKSGLQSLDRYGNHQES